MTLQERAERAIGFLQAWPMGLESEWYSEELKRLFGEDAIALLSELEIVYGASYDAAFLSGLYSLPAPASRFEDRWGYLLSRVRQMMEDLESWISHVGAPS